MLQKYHLVAVPTLSGELKDGQVLPTVQGKDLKVSLPLPPPPPQPPPLLRWSGLRQCALPPPHPPALSFGFLATAHLRLERLFVSASAAARAPLLRRRRQPSLPLTPPQVKFVDGAAVIEGIGSSAKVVRPDIKVGKTGE